MAFDWSRQLAKFSQYEKFEPDVMGITVAYIHGHTIGVSPS
jgi:hypothetical protein